MKQQTKKIITTATFILVVISVFTAQAQSPQETINQYISDLQKKPNDYALRERIIKFVQQMKPAPAIPEEARRYFIEGNALLKAAKEQKGYELALDSYRQCLLIAPWWGEAYYNYAVALDLANKFDEAMNALKLYIATNPGEGESRKAQDKIYEIGAKKKLAALESQKSSPQTVGTPKEDPFEALLKKIDGRRYTMPWGRGKDVIDVRGKVFVHGSIDNQGYSERIPSHRVEIRDRETTHSMTTNTGFQVEETYIISKDGDRIDYRTRNIRTGNVSEYIYLWQR